MTTPTHRPESPLAGQVAVVTGGAGDIGRAIASALAGAGASVVLTDVLPVEEWPNPPSESPADGEAHVTADVLDITDTGACEDLVARTRSRWGRLDIVVNNAGINIRKPLVHTSEAEWLRVQDVNVNGAYRMCRAAHPALAAAESPVVVNIASTAGVAGIRGTAAYGVSKAALIQLTRVLAVEWAPDGIRVNAVAPTIVPTAMTADIMGDRQALDEKLATLPLGEVVEPDEVGAAVVYLASPAARSVTGHTLLLDGGFSVT